MLQARLILPDRVTVYTARYLELVRSPRRQSRGSAGKLMLARLSFTLFLGNIRFDACFGNSFAGKDVTKSVDQLGKKYLRI